MRYSAGCTQQPIELIRIESSIRPLLARRNAGRGEGPRGAFRFVSSSRHLHSGRRRVEAIQETSQSSNHNVISPADRRAETLQIHACADALCTRIFQPDGLRPGDLLRGRAGKRCHHQSYVNSHMLLPFSDAIHMGSIPSILSPEFEDSPNCIEHHGSPAASVGRFHGSES